MRRRVREPAAAHRSGSRPIRDTVDETIGTLDATPDPATWISRVPCRRGDTDRGRLPGLRLRPGALGLVVRSLVRAAAVLVGKTNLDQFATGLVGTRTP